ncbi:putative F-box/LRR-repeat protein At4g13960 isoform X1 [Ananas comosus]|uniref:F-box/LRR-repeat protein At4g13960 isoform X1 n=1 Tax=Ananas comosus TaxID=4615 RepID=A0A6P5EJI1_ANACO|nr:putative F-box/LRR-repeat protein At4g13960 isoform X1 [Ananas comosus]
MEHSKTVSQFQQNAHTRDHISELPDDILNRIFSLLTLRDAAKAKLLSRRWRRHPTFVSNLCLDPLTMFGIQIGRCSCLLVNNEFKDKLIREVNQILHVYEALSRDIYCFTVGFRLGDESACHIDSWISWALRMRARKIDLAPFLIYHLIMAFIISHVISFPAVNHLT